MIGVDAAHPAIDQDRGAAGGEPGYRAGARERIAQDAFDGPTVESGRLAAILAPIRHHRRWIVAVLLVAVLATLVAYALIPRRFTAQADLWLDHGFEQLGPAAPATAASSSSPLARNTEIRLLASSELAGTVVDRLGLANVRGVGQPREGPLVPRATARRRAIAAVRDNLRVETNGASYAVVVRQTAADPVLATAILNQLVEAYVADRRSGGPRGRARAAMQAQVAAARDDLIRSQAAMAAYRDAVGLAGRAPDRAAIDAELASLDAAIKAADAEQEAADARLREARGAATGADATRGATSSRIRALRARQAQLAAERNGQSAFDSRINAARAGEIGRELATEERRVARLEEAATAARTRTELLRAARLRASDALASAEAAAIQLARIGEEAAVARTRFADFAGRYNALVAAQRRDPGTAYVIARGSPRAARSFPDPLLFAAIGLGGGLLAAGLLVLLLELLTKGFRSRRQLEATLGLPVIGLVPDLAKVRDADFPPDDPMGPPDYLYNRRHSAFSAAFRGIHTGLRLGLTGRSQRSFAICSALPEEGKTTVALCLARSAALAGLRVVLVDCDARRPAASRALSPYVKAGLAHVLEDGVSFREVLQCDTPSGAWFIAQSSNRPVANGAVASPRMAALIAQLAREFDLVLLDTAPALALSEARELAAMADGVLLIARARKTPVEATRMARELLEKAGAYVVAATLTLVDP